jgi:hypothetical protein
MATQPLTTPNQNQTVEDKIRRLRELYADAPEVARTALENLIGGMKAALGSEQKARLERASINGRIGLRQGKVSELTVILKLLPGGAKRIRAMLDMGTTNADKIGTLHDMRYALFDNDTKILFCTTYDTEWDPYINDFATQVPDDLDSGVRQLRRLAGDSQPRDQRLGRQAPDSGRRLVCRPSRSDGGGSRTAEAHRQGG